MALGRILAREGAPLQFADRVDAGRRLAPLLAHLKGPDTVVLGLPRGGVPVAREVAIELGVPVDVIVVRKLGVPWQPELAMGAIGEEGVKVLNDEILRHVGLDAGDILQVEAAERRELERRVEQYRGGRGMADLTGKTAIVVDDGIATGSTAQAACSVARAHGAARVVVAAPVASRQAAALLAEVADEVICLSTPSNLGAIGFYYRDFSQTSDGEVRDILDEMASHGPAGTTPQDVSIDLAEVSLPGLLTLVDGAQSIVVFAHGSGSSMHSPRNRRVSYHLNRAGHATLLFDLLTAAESGDRRNVFDIPLLARRLAGVTDWLGRRPSTRDLVVGYFGASTGAAAALQAAAALGGGVGAIVSRGGRPDLAGPCLEDVLAPTLLIVGGNDTEVLALNRDAARHLTCPHEVAVVAGAGHLFEESGTMDAVARLATDWFTRLRGAAADRPGPSRRLV